MAAGKPAPAGGSAAALTVAQAAALCAKTARLSARQLTADRAGQLTTEADRIRTAAVGLVDQDARAYAGVIEHARKAAAARRDAGARAAGAEAGPADAPDDQVSELMASLARALSKAADVPMEVVELAAQVAGIAAPLAAVGNPALRGDAVAAALLAQAGARAAATLVAINLADSPDDLRPARAFDLLASIAQAVEKASAEH
jgi:formiminotetrahydrofolate cyclodeaminase